MSELDDLKTSVSNLSADLSSYVSTVSAEFATLAAQIAALQTSGSGATAQDLTDLKTQVDVVDAAIKAAPTAPPA